MAVVDTERIADHYDPPPNSIILTHGSSLLERSLSEGKIVVVQERKPNLLDCRVAMSLVKTDDLPIDQEHVATLRYEFDELKRQGSPYGQKSPLTLADTGTQDLIWVTDGYHRSYILETDYPDLVDDPIAEAVLALGSTMHDMVRERAANAIPHTKLKFPRMTNIVGQMWDLLDWSKKITIIQAFNLAWVKSMTGRNLGLDSKDTQDLQAWIHNICRAWDIDPQTAAKYFAVAAGSAPDLIMEVRPRAGGREFEALTVDHLRLISNPFKGRFDIQRVIKETVLGSRLTIENTRRLMLTMDREMTADEARVFLDKGSWKDQLVVVKKGRPLGPEAGGAEIARLTGEVQRLTAERRRESVELERVLADNVFLNQRVKTLEGGTAVKTRFSSTEPEARLVAVTNERDEMAEQNRSLLQRLEAEKERSAKLQDEQTETARERDGLREENRRLKTAPSTTVDPEMARKLDDAQRIIRVREAEIAQLKSAGRTNPDLVREIEQLRRTQTELSGQLKAAKETFTDKPAIVSVLPPEIADSILADTLTMAQLYINQAPKMGNEASPVPTIAPDRLHRVLDQVSREVQTTPPKRTTAELLGGIALVDSGMIERLETQLQARVGNAVGRVQMRELAEKAILLTLVEIRKDGLTHRCPTQFDYWMLKVLSWQDRDKGQADPKRQIYLQELRKFVPFLGSSLRLTFVLSEYLNKSTAEVADILGITEDEVKRRASEARRELCQKVGGVN